ncbi:hypothetical protein KKC83_03645 [Patescibacteria group bacterium]|nr:cell envelope integrity protein TolA [Candidatus Falkowbacteria bacterium]MBU3905500.1 hypothetical protein [Patescibacteria group bacterium]MBU4026607.1 hypothetical protein [Patescibacteria group bacterium]MBU4073506.1 hypothetical protein [Patescibacteria group bacterium]MBU4103114.1 hypothetical protein [Patescibacteria group bacterium]
MPDNKMLDGIKKINGRDFRKARYIVLKSIGETRKEAHAENSYQKLPKEDSGFSFEKNKKENIPQSKKVDGISFGNIGQHVHRGESAQSIKPEKQREISAEEKRLAAEKREEAVEKLKQAEEKRLAAIEKEQAVKKNKLAEEQAAMLSAKATEKLKKKKLDKKKKTRKHKNTKTGKHENTKTRKRKNGKTQGFKNISRVKAVLRFFAYALPVSATAFVLFYILLFMALAVFDYDSSAARKASEYLPVPALAAKIGMVGYYGCKDAMDDFYYYGKGISKEKIKRELIKELAVKNFAEQIGIQAADEEAELEFNKIISGKSEDEIKNIMGAYYELGSDRYIERVIKPRLVSEKASQAVLSDREINYPALSKIAAIKQAAEAGRDFYAVAEEMGDGLGFGEYYSYDEAISMFGDSAASISPGQTSDVIIINNKYYIIHCFARREDSIGLRHVFINAKSLDDYIQEAVSGLKVWSFVE